MYHIIISTERFLSYSLKVYNLTAMLWDGGNGGRVKLATKPVTTVQGCVSTFARMTTGLFPAVVTKTGISSQNTIFPDAKANVFCALTSPDHRRSTVTTSETIRNVKLQHMQGLQKFTVMYGRTARTQMQMLKNCKCMKYIFIINKINTGTIHVIASLSHWLCKIYFSRPRESSACLGSPSGPSGSPPGARQILIRDT